MRASRKIIYFGVLIAAAALVASMTFRLSSGVTAPEAATHDAKPSAPMLRLSADEIHRAGIKVERFEAAEYAGTLAAFGTVGPNRNAFARVTSPVAGRLVKIAIDLGADVPAGAPLAVLESPELAEARTTFRQSQTELDLARLNLDRAQKLSVDAAIAQKDVLRTRADYERARAALAAAEARLATLGVAAEPPAGSSPASLTVSAPLAGTIVFASSSVAVVIAIAASPAPAQPRIVSTRTAQLNTGSRRGCTVSAPWG